MVYYDTVFERFGVIYKGFVNYNRVVCRELRDPWSVWFHSHGGSISVVCNDGGQKNLDVNLEH